MSTNKVNKTEKANCSCEGPSGYCDSYEPGFNYGCFHSMDNGSPISAAITRNIVDQIDSQVGGNDYESMNLVQNQESDSEAMMFMDESDMETEAEGMDGNGDYSWMDMNNYNPTGYYNRSSNYFKQSSWWMKIILCLLSLFLIGAIVFAWQNRQSIKQIELGIPSLTDTSSSIQDTLNDGVDQLKNIFEEAKKKITG